MLIQESSYVWIPGDTTQEPIPVYDHTNNYDNSSSHNFSTSSWPSTKSNMPEMSVPTSVYKRKKIHRSSTPTFIEKRKKTRRSSTSAFVYNRRKAQKKPTTEENPKSKMMVSCTINDYCPSLKSQMDIYEKNLCISFIRSYGVFERHRSRKRTGVRNDICCLRSCKVCNQTDTTLNMLICDLCDESSHLSCCYPTSTKVPVGEWFCDSCLRKKLKESNPRKSTVDNTGRILSMLRSADPYKSNVRVGKDFQAAISDWSDPIIYDLIEYGEPTEISHVECDCYQDPNSSTLSRLGSIGNWLQCRQVVDGDGNICGKWRRAPLFEVQTNNWECFHTVLWDPAHADCAVPQECDTDQVLMQLEYIQMV
ncbi:zinc finger, CW-type containing protein [Tanacetum coccineum]